jgi:uncharacterized protein (TIGR03382 family)
MTTSASGSGQREVLRLMSGYLIAVPLFWLVFALNATHHWFSLYALVTVASGVGVLMCLGALLLPLIRRRRHSIS